jgi:hypothetical protein
MIVVILIVLVVAFVAAMVWEINRRRSRQRS